MSNHQEAIGEIRNERLRYLLEKGVTPPQGQEREAFIYLAKASRLVEAGIVRRYTPGQDRVPPLASKLFKKRVPDRLAEMPDLEDLEDNLPGIVEAIVREMGDIRAIAHKALVLSFLDLARSEVFFNYLSSVKIAFDALEAQIVLIMDEDVHPSAEDIDDAFNFVLGACCKAQELGVEHFDEEAVFGYRVRVD